MIRREAELCLVGLCQTNPTKWRCDSPPPMTTLSNALHVTSNLTRWQSDNLPQKTLHRAPTHGSAIQRKSNVAGDDTPALFEMTPTTDNDAERAALRTVFDLTGKGGSLLPGALHYLFLFYLERLKNGEGLDGVRNYLVKKSLGANQPLRFLEGVVKRWSDTDSALAAGHDAPAQAVVTPPKAAPTVDKSKPFTGDW